MEKLTNQISLIPKSTLIDLVGINIVKALGESNPMSRKQIATLAIDLFGKNIFKQKKVFQNLLYTLDKKQLSKIHEKTNEKKSIVDYEKFQFELTKNKFKKNKICKYVLDLFDENIESYFGSDKSDLLAKEIVSPSYNYEETGEILPNMYSLHDYQKRVKDEIINEIIKPKSKFIVHMPTGAGKTKTSVEAIIDFWRSKCKNNGFIIWITERKELCEQAFDTFKTTWRFRGDIDLNLFRLFDSISPSLDQLDSGIIFIGFKKFQSLINKNDPVFIKLKEETHLIIVDEAHRSIANTYKHCIDSIISNNHCRLVGLTATPGRVSSESNSTQNAELSQYFSTKKINITNDSGIEIKRITKYLQENEYLAKINRKLIPTNIALDDSEVKEIKKNNKLPKEYLEKLSNDALRNLLIVTEIKSAVEVRSDPTLVFANSVEHAVIIKLLLKNENIQSEYILGETPSVKRRELINDFKENRLPVLINFEVLREGFDAPNIKTLVIARATLSIVLYSQMLGRALRGPKMGGASKINTIIDFKDNYKNLGSLGYSFNYFDEFFN